MRIGNISQGKIRCDNCKRIVLYSERYLIIHEKKGIESDEEGNELKRYCVDCAVKKGYGEYRQEKKERILTFFKGEITPLPNPEGELEKVELKVVEIPEVEAEKEE